MVTLESSLNSLKLALAQFGSERAVGQASAMQPLTSVTSGNAGTVKASGITLAISLTRAATRQLDMQRQLDSAYRAQAMLEVAGNASAQMMARLKNLKKNIVQATSETLAQSERAFLISQFEGIHQTLLSSAQNTRWESMRLFDGSAGARREHVSAAEAAKSMSNAIDLAMQTITRFGDDLGVAGLQLASAVQAISSRQSSASTPTSQQSGTAYVNAISSMLRTQIAGNSSQATQAQANFTPQAVINTLQF